MRRFLSAHRSSIRQDTAEKRDSAYRERFHSAQNNFFFAGNDLTTDIGVDPLGLQSGEGRVGGLGADDHSHAHAHIEGVEHIVLVDAALFLEQTENGGCFDSGLVDLGAQAVGDAAGDILVEAAAGDVADALHVRGLDAAEDGLDIDDGGTEQGFAQGFTQLVIIPAQIGVFHVEHIADQRVAVVENSDSYIPVIVHHNKNELIVEVGEQDKKIYRIGRNELNKTS